MERQKEIITASFEFVTDIMLEKILAHFKEEGLTKSDKDLIVKLLGKKNMGDSIGGIVPKFKINFDFIRDIINKHLDALRWIFLGKAAGEEVEKNVEELKLKDQIPAGTLFGTFLHSIDMQRDFFTELLNKPAPKIDNSALKYSLDFVKNRGAKWVDNSLTQYKNQMLQTIEDKLHEANNDNMAAVHDEYHKLRDETKKDVEMLEHRKVLVQDALENVMTHKMSLSEMKRSLKEATHDYGRNWDRLVNTEFGMASGAGSHMAMLEVFGKEDDNMHVANINVDDKRCCDDCDKWSRKENGRFKIYRLADIKPVGYNMNRKRSEWRLTAGCNHCNCRCHIVYIPEGFTVDNVGYLRALKDGEKLIIEEVE